MKIGEIIKKYRESKGISIDEFIKNSELTKSYISMLENDLNPATGKPLKPSLSKIRIIAEAMSIDLNQLLNAMDPDSEVDLHDDFNLSKKNDPKGVKIPVLGKVAAGIPLEAIEDVLDWEEITEDVAKTGKFFALQIRGDSMSPKILEGDVVIVRQQSNADSGDIVIAIVNGYDGCCKKLIKNDVGITLQSLNPNYEPMVFTNRDVTDKPVMIVGKVVELRRKFL